MKAVVAAFNQEKALVGAFSVVVKTSRNLREGSFEALPGCGLRGGWPCTWWRRRGGCWCCAGSATCAVSRVTSTPVSIVTQSTGTSGNSLVHLQVVHFSRALKSRLHSRWISGAVQINMLSIHTLHTNRYYALWLRVKYLVCLSDQKISWYHPSPDFMITSSVSGGRPFNFASSVSSDVCYGETGDLVNTPG